MYISMGRHRSHDFDLPPRVQRKGNAFYYVTSGQPRRWIPLGSDPQRMRREWVALENANLGTSIQQLCDKYLADCTDGLAASTISTYKGLLAAVAAEFGTFHLDEITHYHVAQWRDHIKQPLVANARLKLGRMAFAKACEWGWCAVNPFAGVERRKVVERDRYLTNDEFLAIKKHARPWLQVAMDLAYLTGMRRSDVLALRWSDISGSQITLRQIKTGQRQVFAVDAELAAVLEQARSRSILGLYVIATPKGRPVSIHTHGYAWRAAVRACGVSDAHFHDIRAKYATDAKRLGLDYQAGLGHRSIAQSEKYVKRRETIIAPSLPKKLSR